MRAVLVSVMMSLVSALCSCNQHPPRSGAPVVVYYLNDHQGSVQLVVDETGAVVSDETRYPYGIDRASAAPQSGAEYGYTGKEYDRETGLIYFGKRYYAPVLGRWITPDPLVVEDVRVRNLYVYARNNPVSFTDPDGLWDERIHYGSEEFGGTLQWAQDAGFSLRQAEIIARADNETDGPMLKWGTTGPYPWQEPSRHFNVNRNASDGTAGDSRMRHAEVQLSRALREAQLGDMDNAMRQLGIGLHSVQDTSAHRSTYVRRTFGVYHHLFHMEADDPLRNTRGFEEARSDTLRYLGRFHDVLMTSATD